MANLFFPQLSTGAIAQYPFKRTRLGRSIKNVLPGGEMILLPDSGASKLVWELQYSALSAADTRALTALFQACAGPVRAFTFIDPADNMLASSGAFVTPAWIVPGTITVAIGATDPAGGTNAVTLTNTGQVPQALTQTLAVPAWYQYCFSVYAVSNQQATLTLTMQGSAAQASTTYPVDAIWNRIITTRALSDSSSTFTVGIQLAAGQQITVYGPQLEPQRAPSRYRSTGSGGVYAKAHWGSDAFFVTAQAPNLFSTSFLIETAIQD